MWIEADERPSSPALHDDSYAPGHAGIVTELYEKSHVDSVRCNALLGGATTLSVNSRVCHRPYLFRTSRANSLNIRFQPMISADGLSIDSTVIVILCSYLA